MADISREQPVEGARVVDFDYDAASSALDALDTMASRMNTEADRRVDPKEHAVVDWQGHFRDEFERAWGQLQARFNGDWGAVARTVVVRGMIEQAISDANAQQRLYNQQADEQRALNDVSGASGSVAGP